MKTSIAKAQPSAPACGMGCRLAVVLSFTLLGAVPLFAAAPAARSSAEARVEYNRDVRPILSENCFFCHGPDKNQRKAKLRLDIREEAIAKEAFVPGKPDESELVKRILTTDEDDVMPPPDSHKHLTAAQKETLRRWIAEGAEYQPHWAYVLPTRPEAPAVKNRKRVRNPIDAFILQSLEAKNFKPSREADRRTLLRRLSLDLIGLPPTPGEIAAFVADKDPRAYEKQVERLLASPHFGERMAVPWLDTVRFSDTVGYHGDQNQRIFPYRDYVIASFNQNKPYDRFTIEQLAGDLLPNPTIEQRVATGFNRLNMVTREGGAQPNEYLAKYAADRVRTVGTTWLGSTMGCAECHDHKFDPTTSRDFYSMAAFFADVKQWGVYSNYKYTPNPELKGWSNEHPFPPELEVESDYLKHRTEHFRGLIREHFLAFAAQSGTNAAFADWLRVSREFLTKAPDGWQRLNVVLPNPPAPAVTFTTNITTIATNIVARTNQPAPPTITLAGDGSVRVALSKKKEEEKIELRPPPGRIAALRLERLGGDSDEELDPGAQASGIRLSAALKRNGKETKVSFYRADADHKEPRYANGEELIGVLAGWKPSNRHAGERQTAVWLPEPPLQVTTGDTLTVTLKSTGPLTVRLAVSPFAAQDPLQAGGEAFAAALKTVPAARNTAQRALLAERYLLSTQSDVDAFATFKQLQADLLECRNGRTHTMVTESQQPYTMRVLPRGNWQNEGGDIVQPVPPHFLPQPKSTGADSLTRLDLARWLVSRENPLTARVFINRLWKQFFGTGISAAVDDLGAQGEWPVHPALLDWLAVEFMEPSLVGAEVTRLKSFAANAGAIDQSLLTSAPAHAWDIKHMVRLIVTSSTYRQDSNLRLELRDLDPQNRWLASQNPRRLDAEFVRDNALFVAGLLSLDLGGPSARPYQPAGYYANLQFPDRDYKAQDDGRQYRRGVYMHWQRTFLHPMLANFDAPSREECTANRPASNTPQQALTLLNDPAFVEAARVFAGNLLSSTRTSDKARIEAAYLKALGRAPKSKEATSLAKFLGEQRAYYKQNPEDSEKLLNVGSRTAPRVADETELAAWTQVCRVVLNLHESVTRY